MFDIMFMRQKRNETAQLIWIAPSSLEQNGSGADALVTRALNSAVRSSVKRLNSAMNTNYSVI